MTIWLAYHLDSETSEADLEDRLGRVARYHEDVYAGPLVRQGLAGPRLGAVVWDPADQPCRWPAWAGDRAGGVATAYVPIGWQRLLGDVEPGRAAAALGRVLVSDPTRVSLLTPPFALAVIDADREELTILNDGLGFARVYTMHFDGGQVWSSRLAALPIFARSAPQMDLRAWRLMSGAGWFLGSSTPVAGAHQLGPSTLITCRPGAGAARTSCQTGSLGRWVSPRGAAVPDIDAAASEIVDTARSVARLWPNPPVVHLSGGWDTRMVAAAVVASGVDAVFHTVASLSGELTVARDLLSRVGDRYEHRVLEEDDVTATGDLRARTLALHRAYDGVYSPAGVKQPLMPALETRAEATLNGAGGEIARGNFYKGRFLEKVAAGRDACFDRLDQLYRFHGGVRDGVHTAVGQAIDAALNLGEELGLGGPSLLDFFYLHERLRRWSNASTRLASVAPLVTPAYVRAAFDCTPKQRHEAAVPHELIRRLVPAWDAVPVYKADKDDQTRMTRPRIWQTSDRGMLQELVETPAAWDDLFEPEAVRDIWREAEEGRGAGKHEMFFQRLVWRTYFPEHLDGIRAAALG